MGITQLNKNNNEIIYIPVGYYIIIIEKNNIICCYWLSANESDCINTVFDRCDYELPYFII